MNTPVSPHAQAKPQISILVVGFNSAAFIERCLGSIETACTHHSYEILFVDQGDGSTQEIVEERFPQTRIVPSRGNIGFAAGNNLLASHARGQFLLLLNPDVEPLPEAIDALVDGQEKYPAASAWGGVTLDANDNPDVGNTVHIPSLREMASRLFGRSSVALNTNSTFVEDEQVDALSGGFVLIARATWDQADGLDERYFLYCEEVDFFYRMGLRGHTFWRMSKARARHFIGHGSVESPMRMLYSAAGVMQFARIHWGQFRQIAAFGLIWLAAVQRWNVGRLLGRWRPQLREVGRSQQVLARKPSFWRFGYDPRRGLLAKLRKHPLD